MPIFRAESKLIFYAHVPKCGGSAIAWYLRERFHRVAFSDTRQTRHDPATLWSRTSPQHIDAQSLGRLFPPDFFDAMFSIVRHPVPRIVSAYHFQLEVEKSISQQVLFSEWLEDITELRADNPFLYDNHLRPMAEIVPEGARVFHMEHGLDGVIPWLDAVTGQTAPPRAIPELNRKGEYSGTKSERVTPSAADLERIARIYAVDFKRFGYDPADTRSTNATPPSLPTEFVDERDAALRAMASPLYRLRSRIARKLGT